MLVVAGGLQAATWQIETLDTTAAGRFSSLKIDKEGNGHVAYVADDGQATLKYAFWDHLLRHWFTMVIAPHATCSALVLDSKQHPHISYADYGNVRGTKVRYAYWDGNSWRKQAIPVNAEIIAFYTSIVLDQNDQPTISYYEYEGPAGSTFVIRLRTVSWNGKYWEGRTADPTPGSGKFNYMAIDSAGNPHIAYAVVRDDHAGLRYTSWDGHSWQVEILEGIDRPFYVYSVSLVLDKADTPHIVYTDVANKRIKYATRPGGKWQFEVVDTLVKEGYPDRHGIGLDEQGTPYISYYDAGLGVLKLAYRKGQQWVSEVVDQGFAGFTSSLQIDHGTIWLTYADENAASLKCARRPLQEVLQSRTALPTAKARE